MKTWAAVLSVVGLVLLGCGCAAQESAADADNTQEEEGVTGAAREAVFCRQVCRSQCTIDRFRRRVCTRVCQRVCN